MKTTLSQPDIDKALHLLKLAKLHSKCSLDFGIELQAAITECQDIDHLIEHLEPILTSSIQNIQSSRAELRSIQRQNHQKTTELA